MGWQKASGYNWRALVEADIGRWKRVFGHALRSQTNERQAAEVAIAVDVPNRFLVLQFETRIRTWRNRYYYASIAALASVW
jgi:hypothetical protein